MPITGNLTFTSVAAGGSHLCAVATGGELYCWGGSFLGELGVGSAAADRAS